MHGKFNTCRIRCHNFKKITNTTESNTIFICSKRFFKLIISGIQSTLINQFPNKFHSEIKYLLAKEIEKHCHSVVKKNMEENLFRLKVPQ